MFVVVDHLLSSFTLLCSKILLILYVDNSSSWSWEGEECLSSHREGQRNRAAQRPAESQIQYNCTAWAARRENKGRRKEGTAGEILVWGDRCAEKTVVYCTCSTCWTWNQTMSCITGTNNVFKQIFFLTQLVILIKNEFIKTWLSNDETV